MLKPIVTLGIIFLQTQAFGQFSPALPYIERGACPFECCQFGLWHTFSALTAYSREGDTSSIAFHLAPGDTFTAITGNLHIERFGLALISKSDRKSRVTDSALVLGYTGEGYYNIFHQGEYRNIELSWSNPNVTPNDTSYFGRLVEPAYMVWWVKIREGGGRIGWIRLVNKTDNGMEFDERIDGVDGCG